MAELVAKVERIFEQIRPTRSGDLETVKVVSYFVGDHGPFQLQIPPAEFDPDKVQALLAEQVEKIRRIMGE